MGALGALAAVLVGLAAPAPAPAATAALSRSALVKKGDAICLKHSRRIATEFERLAKKHRNRPSAEQLRAFVRTTVVPEIGATMDEVAKLVPPPADAAAFRTAVATARRELAAVRRDPDRAISQQNPFGDAAAKFKALGFSRCAQ